MHSISESLEIKCLESLLNPLCHAESLRVLVFKKLKHCGRSTKTSTQNGALALEGMDVVVGSCPAGVQPNLMTLDRCESRKQLSTTHLLNSLHIFPKSGKDKKWLIVEGLYLLL